MNLFKISFFACLLLLCLSGCSENSPEAVAKEFSEAVYGADFKKARSLCTPETQEGVDMIAEMCKDLTSKMKEAKVEVKVESCELDEKGEEAKVLLNVKNRLNLMSGKIDNDVRQEKVRVIKTDGKWLVVFKAK